MTVVPSFPECPAGAAATWAAATWAAATWAVARTAAAAAAFFLSFLRLKRNPARKPRARITLPTPPPMPPLAAAERPFFG